jgi:hypothetical protein
MLNKKRQAKERGVNLNRIVCIDKILFNFYTLTTFQS